MYREISDKSRITDTVLVLLSSYNGEKYIAEQIDSILDQTVPVYLLIRDDGSTDSTVNIIDGYVEKHDNIKLIKGENLGFYRSFNALIDHSLVNDYEFIAFSDQDDHWLPDKLSAAVSMLLSDYDRQIPTTYFSNMNFTDEELKTYDYRNRKPIKVTKQSLFVACSCAGCTMVFNHSAAGLYKMGMKQQMPFHDYQLLSVCLFMGKCIYDHNSYILYRQHGNNTIGVKLQKTIIGGLIEAIKDIGKPKLECKKVLWFKAFERNYEEFLSPKDRKLINTFTDHEHRFINRLKITFDPKFKCTARDMVGFKTTLSFKFRVLTNRMEYYGDCK